MTLAPVYLTQEVKLFILRVAFGVDARYPRGNLPKRQTYGYPQYRDHRAR